MIVFYSNKVNNGELIIENDEFKHCVKVLRKNIGDEINVFDSEGNVYNVTIISIDKDKLIGKILSTTLARSTNHHFCLAIAPTKKADRMEWMISKIVEIGVQEVWFIKTKRTEFAKYKVDRLNKIMFSAAKQSLNYKLPKFREFDSLKSALQETEAFTHRYIAHCSDPKDFLLNKGFGSDAKVLALIGPEGDFTPEEIALAQDHDFEEVSLGPSRLRTETAGLVAVTLLNASLIR
jgi:16S rRNA (uracil1498-N3)-methyltransferase